MKEPEELKKYTLKEHILELKRRITYVLLFSITLLITIYCYSEELSMFLLKPLLVLIDDVDVNRKIIYTNLTEAFFSYVKISVFFTFCVAFPFILFQIYLFLKPGLYLRERKLLMFVFISSVVLFFIGSAVLFYLVIPKAWIFFLSFERHSTLVPLLIEPKLSEYLDLVMALMVAFGAAFQTPIVIIVLNILGLLSSTTLKSKRKISVVISFIVGAIFTPPDVLSQIALALSLILLYEFSIIVCGFLERSKNKI